MSNKTYDILKCIALTVLPALATLVTALGKIWSIEVAPLIAATITALATFLGAVLLKASSDYKGEEND